MRACRPLRLLLPLLGAALTAACTDVPEPSVAAQVGSARLSMAELRLSVPMDRSGQDSLNYVRRYVDQWVNDQLLYEHGVRNLTSLPELEALVDDYRRRLIAQAYENELLVERYGNVSEEECQRYYEQHGATLLLRRPVIQAVVVRIPDTPGRLEAVRRWVKELSEGKDDGIEELDHYCAQYAIDYDNFLAQWSETSRLTDRLPPGSVQLPPTRRPQEVKGDGYVSIYLVRDYLPAGEVQPYDYARSDIREAIGRQRRADFHVRLLQDLRAEGERTGFVKINLKQAQ